jgi:hypothetical protein
MSYQNKGNELLEIENRSELGRSTRRNFVVRPAKCRADYQCSPNE